MVDACFQLLFRRLGILARCVGLTWQHVVLTLSIFEPGCDCILILQHRAVGSLKPERLVLVVQSFALLLSTLQERLECRNFNPQLIVLVRFLVKSPLEAVEVIVLPDTASQRAFAVL